MSNFKCRAPSGKKYPQHGPSETIQTAVSQDIQWILETTEMNDM